MEQIFSDLTGLVQSITYSDDLDPRNLNMAIDEYRKLKAAVGSEHEDVKEYCEASMKRLEMAVWNKISEINVGAGHYFMEHFIDNVFGIEGEADIIDIIGIKGDGIAIVRKNHPTEVKGIFYKKDDADENDDDEDELDDKDTLFEKFMADQICNLKQTLGVEDSKDGLYCSSEYYDALEEETLSPFTVIVTKGKEVIPYRIKVNAVGQWVPMKIIVNPLNNFNETIRSMLKHNPYTDAMGNIDLLTLFGPELIAEALGENNGISDLICRKNPHDIEKVLLEYRESVGNDKPASVKLHEFVKAYERLHEDNSIFAEGLDDFKTLDAVERLKFLLAENTNWNNGCYYVDAYRKTKDIFDRIQEYKTRAIEAARTGFERSGLYPTVPLYDFLATIYNVNGDYKDSGQK